MAALAAEAADDAPRTSMIAAPRLATVGVNTSRVQVSSTSIVAFVPLTSAWDRSGYCVEEWLPQMVTLRTALAGTARWRATWETARLWSRRIMAVERAGGMSGACGRVMSAVGVAGFPTTRTRTSSAAWALR